MDVSNGRFRLGVNFLLTKGLSIANVSNVRIIAETTLRLLSAKHAKVLSSVENWIAVVRGAAWSRHDDIKATFNSVDVVHLESASTVYIFNINDYRLIAAVHFTPKQPAKGRVYILEFLTHAEYDKQRWKTRY